MKSGTNFINTKYIYILHDGPVIFIKRTRRVSLELLSIFSTKKICPNHLQDILNSILIIDIISSICPLSFAKNGRDIFLNIRQMRRGFPLSFYHYFDRFRFTVFFVTMRSPQAQLTPFRSQGFRKKEVEPFHSEFEGTVKKSSLCREIHYIEIFLE